MNDRMSLCQAMRSITAKRRQCRRDLDRMIADGRPAGEVGAQWGRLTELGQRAEWLLVMSRRRLDN